MPEVGIVYATTKSNAKFYENIAYSCDKPTAILMVYRSEILNVCPFYALDIVYNSNCRSNNSKRHFNGILLAFLHSGFPSLSSHLTVFTVLNFDFV